MLFNTLKFAVFLLVVFAVYRVIERWRWPRTLWLLAASYLFYASWNPWYLILIVASTVLDYVIGGRLAVTEGARARRGLLIASIVGNLGLLSVFKYGNFVLENIEQLAAMMGSELHLQRIGVALPVGISFYTFQTLSYTIDLYRRRIETSPSSPCSSPSSPSSSPVPSSGPASSSPSSSAARGWTRRRWGRGCR
jgi:alginate O-acetyltransferase complex protein AlgI